MTLRWGVLGTGRIARTLASDLHWSETSRVYAAGSRTADGAAAYAAVTGVETVYSSYEELCADPLVDVVYVATPHPFHLENALVALRHGKPVVVEKAFTMNATEAQTLVTAARDAELFAMEAMWTRFLPHIHQVRQLLAEGRLGRIRMVIADHGKWFRADPASRLFAPELGGSALLDLGVYPVSLASMVLGAPLDIRALNEPAFTGVDGQISMISRHEGGAHAVLTCSSFARSSVRCQIVGEMARVEIDGDFYGPARLHVIDRDGATESWQWDIPGRGLQFQADAVAHCLTQGWTESPEMPLDESVRIMQWMDVLRAS